MMKCRFFGVLAIALLVSSDSFAQTFTLTDTSFNFGDTLRTQGLVFEVGKSNLLERNHPFLDSLVLLLKENPTLELIVARHSGWKISKEVSTFITQRRADAIAIYLVEAGIAAERLTSIGYQDSAPLIPWDVVYAIEDEKERLAAHRHNARTEFIIIGK